MVTIKQMKKDFAMKKNGIIFFWLMQEEIFEHKKLMQEIQVQSTDLDPWINGLVNNIQWQWDDKS